jgi:L,D-peptidoglycan transpeptidase YkuD (ErfK/YbiS/YcfS/YnhG family)
LAASRRIYYNLASPGNISRLFRLACWGLFWLGLAWAAGPALSQVMAQDMAEDLSGPGQILRITPQGQAIFAGQSYSCSLGRAGVRQDKREGDGATPAGEFALREVLYRPDKLGRPPATALPCRALSPDDGWCDDPRDQQYNRPVKLPYPASHEKMWREDDLYDLVVVVGYNDQPVVPGRGSAIFLHLARPGYAPTAGCVALAKEDMLRLLERLGPVTRVVIQAPPGP